MTPDRRTWMAVLAVVLALSPAGPAPACGASQEKVTRVPKVDPPKAGPPAAAPAPKTAGWGEALGYDLSIAGAADGEARFFRSPDFQKILVVPGKGESAFLLSLKAKQAASIPRRALTLGDDEATPPPGGEKSLGAYAQKGADITFVVAGAEYKVVPQPPLVGEIALDELLAKKKDYAAAARSYQPSAVPLRMIQAVQAPIQITVFFGSWCMYCKKWLPRFMRTIDAAANAHITVRYIGVDEDMTQPEALLSQFGVSRTPTFIISAGGRELGRIVEQPKDTIEGDLAVILMGGR